MQFWSHNRYLNLRSCSFLPYKWCRVYNTVVIYKKYSRYKLFTKNTYFSTVFPNTDSQELTPEVVDSVVELFLCRCTTSAFNFRSNLSRNIGSGTLVFIISNVFDSDNDLLWWPADGVWLAGRVRDFCWGTEEPEKQSLTETSINVFNYKLSAAFSFTWYSVQNTQER